MNGTQTNALVAIVLLWLSNSTIDSVKLSLLFYRLGSECDINLSYDVNLGPTKPIMRGNIPQLGRLENLLEDERWAFQLNVRDDVGVTKFKSPGAVFKEWSCERGGPKVREGQEKQGWCQRPLRLFPSHTTLTMDQYSSTPAEVITSETGISQNLSELVRLTNPSIPMFYMTSVSGNQHRIE